MWLHCKRQTITLKRGDVTMYDGNMCGPRLQQMVMAAVMELGSAASAPAKTLLTIRHRVPSHCKTLQKNAHNLSAHKIVGHAQRV